MMFEMEEPDQRLVLIYGESVRKLDQQAAVVEALRGRTALLFGAGSVSVSFLAPEAIKHGGWSWQAWAGSAGLVVAASFAFAILWPYRWRFSHKPKELLRVYVEGGKPRTINGMHKWLATKNEDYFAANRRTLDRLFACYQIATIMLGVSITSWLVLLTR